MVLKIVHSDGKKVDISYPAIFSDDEAEERGEFKIRLINFGQVFEDETRQWAYAKAMMFLLDKINEYRKETGKSASEFMKDFPPNTEEELIPLLQRGEEVGELSDEYDESLEEFFEGSMFYIDKLKKWQEEDEEEWTDEDIIKRTQEGIDGLREFAKAYNVPIITFGKDEEDSDE